MPGPRRLSLLFTGGLILATSLACAGRKVDCKDGTHEEGGDCVPDDETDFFAEGDADTDTDADADTDADTDADSDTDTDTDSDSDTDADSDTDTDTDTDTTVQDVQLGVVTGPVDLLDVVATSNIDPMLSGFYVQDLGGGEWSGVYVYLQGVSFDVQAGDLLSVSGEATEYYDQTEIVVSATDGVKVAGKGVPTALRLSAPPADWEPYEGGLVTLEDLSVTSAANSYGEANTTYDILLDDFFYAWEDSWGQGDGFSELTGLVSYTYEAFKLEPRDSGDLVP